jgi:hypothetical protein
MRQVKTSLSLKRAKRFELTVHQDRQLTLIFNLIEEAFRVGILREPYHQ